MLEGHLYMAPAGAHAGRGGVAVVAMGVLTALEAVAAVGPLGVALAVCSGGACEGKMKPEGVAHHTRGGAADALHVLLLPVLKPQGASPEAPASPRTVAAGSPGPPVPPNAHDAGLEPNRGSLGVERAESDGEGVTVLRH